MRVDVEVNGRKISAVSVNELPQVDSPDVVVDCRKSIEVPEGEAAPAKGVRIPFTAQTLSEQDMDQLRHEFVRSPGPIAVVSETGWRAAAAVLAHAGRVLGWSAEDTLGRCPGLEEKEHLARWVRDYLARHADRGERRDLVM